MLKKLAFVLLLLAALFFLALPPFFERMAMSIKLKPPYHPSARAEAFAARTPAADLHADTLLWSRDLNQRGSRGHVDIPRLIDANVALQAFTIVTRVPLGMNFQRNRSDAADLIQILALAELWPPRTWPSLTARALYQADKFHRAARDSAGRLTPLESRQDLATYLDRRRQDSHLTAGFLGIEGAQALDGNLDNIDVLYAAGIRMMSASHFYDTDIGGSSAGWDKGGLTDKGKEMVRRMEARGMLVDVAHSSERVIDDVLSIARHPVVDSHTGVKATCETPRNLSDAHLRGIARTGGVIGIAYFAPAVCGDDAAAIARAIRHAVDIAGIDHVALGSDFDGAIPEPFDTTGLPLLYDALFAQGFTEQDVAKIAGANVFRVLSETLP